MNKPGVILITTLLIVMILSIISVQISKNFYISLKREAYLDFKNLSHQMLMSSEKQAIKSLQKNVKPFQSKLTLNDSLLNNKFYFQNDLMVLEVSVLDASNCFNLNSLFKPSGNSYEIRPLYKAWLKRYLKLKQFNEADIESFIDQLVDWVDHDNQPLNFGAENYFYIGPASKISQFTPKRLLVDISEINNFPIMERMDYRDLITNLCVLPNRNNQIININSLVQSDSLLIAAFFDEENLEYTSSQILNMPKNGYDDVNVFIDQFNQASKFPSQVLSINSQTFRLQSDIINENFSANLETLVILDISNSAEVIRRTFNF
ncbi:type II secretion system minor pseudopilin GspK [Gammaproteobacteria bacterium]|nr:type II secretion system minor pseudopilin GspK [Gammaproteobacteria bacterium]MDB9947086.1 type II secretion system minor pseudopilin GspK [Gammaproteobacteria bacterium]